MVPAILLLIEFSLDAMVSDFAHMLHLVLLLFVYGIVNLIATKARGTPVYKILTWDDGGTAGVLVGILVGTLAFYFAFACITRIREKSYGKAPSRRGSADDAGTL